MASLTYPTTADRMRSGWSWVEPAMIRCMRYRSSSVWSGPCRFALSRSVSKRRRIAADPWSLVIRPSSFTQRIELPTKRLSCA